MEQYNNYFFVLGRENKISQKELEYVLAGFGFGFGPSCHCETPDDFGSRGNLSEKIAEPVLSDSEGSPPRNDRAISILADDILEIKLNVSVDKIADLMKILGGTIKIFQKVASSLENIDDVILDSPEKKLILGISNYSRLKVDTFRKAMEIKKRFGQKRSIRVIAGKDGDKLSSAQSYQYKLDHHGIELGLFADGVGKLIAVQNIGEWSCHDYGKPHSDARSGMLPPKLARMMVNIACGSILNFNDVVVVDPFCGSGNILIEALAIGRDVIGSDISEKAVEDTKANIKWFLSEKKLTPIRGPFGTANSSQLKAEIFQVDATTYDFGKINRDFIIISEPYLGQPRKHKLTVEEEKQAMSEASKLYLDFLNNLKLTALPRRQAGNSSKLAAICLVFPLLELKNGKRLSIFDCCIDKIRNFGYILSCPPYPPFGRDTGETSLPIMAGPSLIYGRDYQVVKREIVILKLEA